MDEDITERLSVIYMIMNELIETRKLLLEESDSKTREVLNQHFKNIDAFREKYLNEKQ